MTCLKHPEFGKTFYISSTLTWPLCAAFMELPAQKLFIRNNTLYWAPTDKFDHFIPVLYKDMFTNGSRSRSFKDKKYGAYTVHLLGFLEMDGKRLSMLKVDLDLDELPESQVYLPGPFAWASCSLLLDEQWNLAWPKDCREWTLYYNQLVDMGLVAAYKDEL